MNNLRILSFTCRCDRDRKLRRSSLSTRNELMESFIVSDKVYDNNVGIYDSFHFSV